MKKGLLLGFLFCFWGIPAFSQPDPVLMRIDEEEVRRSEFEQALRKHRGKTASECTPEEYVEIFIFRRLQLKAAEAMGVDTTQDFLSHRWEYRKKIVKQCLAGGGADGSCLLPSHKEDLSRKAGRVKVMQVFRRLPQAITPGRLREERERMDSIYKQIVSRQDVDFAYWMKNFSDDKSPQWIVPLQRTVELEKVAFSLRQGEVSKPFFTPEGIYILKRIEREEVSSPEAVSGKGGEGRRLYAGLPEESVIERLKKDFRYVPNRAGIEELSAQGKTRQCLFTIDGHEYSGTLFGYFSASYPLSVKRQLDLFIAKSLLDYGSRNIGKICPDACQMWQEYEENYLVAEVWRRQVEIPSMTDRAGWATYFKFHRSDYRWKNPKYRGAVLHCIDRKTARQAKRLLKKTPERMWKDTLLKTFNDKEEKIRVEQGLFAYGDNKYIDKLVFKKGEAEPLLSHPFTVVVGKKRKKPDSYREVLDKVKEDYRDFLAARWRRNLRNSVKVEINQEVLKTVNNN